ncbi:MAG: helix-turn-helix domain-containing protein [Clostridia bacterium]|nr:helix-turn-helix domain-containing protein [Clostridia bacterium]
MNQIKIGKFIAEQRKKCNLTQAQLAEKLNITDRAISKWENGRAMPDSSIMLDLCSELKISVNELLSGEVIKMDNFNEKMEENLVDMVKQKEEADKKMLRLEILVGYMSSITFLIIIFVASFVEMPKWLVVLLIAFGITTFAIGMFNCLKIEQTAGYYECAKCHHKYVPTYSSVLWSMHINRTRYMKCPECNKRSWQKKVISK